MSICHQDIHQKLIKMIKYFCNCLHTFNDVSHLMGSPTVTSGKCKLKEQGVANLILWSTASKGGEDMHKLVIKIYLLL